MELTRDPEFLRFAGGASLFPHVAEASRDDHLSLSSPVIGRDDYMGTIAQGNSVFTWTYMVASIKKKHDNLFFSPISVSTALAMTMPKKSTRLLSALKRDFSCRLRNTSLGFQSTTIRLSIRWDPN